MLTIKSRMEALEIEDLRLVDTIGVIKSTVDSSKGAIDFKDTIDSATGEKSYDLGFLSLISAADYTLALNVVGSNKPIHLNIIKESASVVKVQAIDLAYYADDEMPYNAILKGALQVEGVLTFNKPNVDDVTGGVGANEDYNNSWVTALNEQLALIQANQENIGTLSSGIADLEALFNEAEQGAV